MILLALDPGLDATGWAAFRVPLKPTLQPGVIRNALLDSGTLRSGINAELPTRLRQLADGLRDVITDHGPDVVVVEVPAYAGLYARNKGKARDAGAFGAADRTAMHQATGALLVTAASCGVPTHTKRADKKDKDAMSAWVYAIWPELADGNSNQDRRDAIYLGAQALAAYASDARRAA